MKQAAVAGMVVSGLFFLASPVAFAGDVDGSDGTGAAVAAAEPAADEAGDLAERLGACLALVEAGRYAEAAKRLSDLHSDVAGYVERNPDDETGQVLLIRVVVTRATLLQRMGDAPGALVVMRQLATNGPERVLDLPEATRKRLMDHELFLEATEDLPSRGGWRRAAESLTRPQTVARIRDGLARVDVLVDVERRFDEALTVAQEHEQAAASMVRQDPDDREVYDLLMKLGLKRAQLLMRLGRMQEARAAMKAFQFLALVDEERTTPHLQRYAMANPEFVARLRELSKEVRQEPEETTVDRLVLGAVQRPYGYSNPNVGLILQLGRRAVPSLEKLLRVEPDRYVPDGNHDLLTILVKIDQQRAVEFIEKHFDQGGVLWKGRIVRAMERASVLEVPDAWQTSGSLPLTCTRPLWIRVIERLAEVPDVQVDALHLSGVLVERGVLTPRLTEAMTRALESGDPSLSDAVVTALGAAPFQNPAALPVLSVAIRHSEPRVRQFAARQFLDYERPEALLARHDDPDPVVRSRVAGALSGRGFRVMAFDASGGLAGIQSRPFQPFIGEEERRILVGLAADTDDRVRRAAFQAIERLSEPLADEVYLGFARHPVEDVRVDVVRLLPKLGPDLTVRLLLELADDPSLEVCKTVDHNFRNAQPQSWTGQEERLLELYLLRLSHPAHPIQHINSRASKNIASILVASAVGREGLVDWLLAHDDPLVMTQVSNKASRWLWRSGPARVAPLVPRLYAASFKETALLFAALTDLGTAGAVAERIDPRSPDLPVELRLWSAIALLQSDVDSGIRATLDVVQGAAWNDEHFDTTALARVTAHVAPDAYNRLALALVRERNAPDRVASEIAEEYRIDGAGAAEVMRAIFERWLSTPGTATRALRNALGHMGRTPSIADRSVLRVAARSEDLDEYAIAAMGALRDPELLPILGELMREQREGSSVWSACVQAITGYMSDEAVDLLLAAASLANHAETRDACLNGVEAIRTYQEARAEWAARRVKQQDRDAVVAELVGMLEDPAPEIRREALRALATFEALEAVPHVIRALRDPDPTVAEAARAALDRLHEAPGGAGDK